MARIVLINPRFEPTYWGADYAMPMLHHKAAMPPANLALLGALTPAGHTVSVIDENIEPLDFDRCAGADIVGVTGMMIQLKRFREILAELKRRGHFVVVGGPCVTVAPEAAEDLADVVFVGEAEQTWPRFLAEWSKGCHQPRYEQEDKTDMTTVPPPRLDLLKMRKYLFGSLQITRGCPFLCEFCDIIVVFGRRPRLKTAAQVIVELDANLAAGKELVFIVDDNLIGNKKAIKSILREIIAWQKSHGYPLVLSTEASIDLAEDDEMLRLMFEANFEAVFVGIESSNEDSLRETKKIQNLADSRGTMLEKVHRIQDAGMEVVCGMIVGFDNDDEGVFTSHRRFIEQSRIVLALVNMLTAMPMTPLYARLMSEGRIDNSGDAGGFSTRSTNVIPLRMSRRTLGEGFVRLMRELYTPAAYFARMDALYLEGNYMPSANRWRYLRHHPWRRLMTRCQYAIETLYMFVQLMRLVPDKELRREYRLQLWKVIRRHPSLTLLRAYCFKSALHFHYHMFIEKIAADRAAMVPEVDNIRPGSIAAPDQSVPLVTEPIAAAQVA